MHDPFRNAKIRGVLEWLWLSLVDFCWKRYIFAIIIIFKFNYNQGQQPVAIVSKLFVQVPHAVIISVKGFKFLSEGVETARQMLQAIVYSRGVVE